MAEPDRTSLLAKVLFPTDFSLYAEAVLAGLPGLRAAGLREVVLIHVVRGRYVPTPEVLEPETSDLVHWGTLQGLEEGARRLRRQGLQVSTRVEYGQPARRIAEVAAEEGVDCIIVGAQGWGFARELLLGDTALSVIRRSSVPVLVVRAEDGEHVSQDQVRWTLTRLFRRVLHPTDFSQCSLSAFEVVRSLHAGGAGEVVLLHVQDERAMRHRDSQQLACFDREDTNRLEALCREARSSGLDATYLLRRGIPFRETLRTAEEKEATVIALGTCGRTVLQELVLGSTFENVVRLSRQPVLAVPCRPT